MKNLFTLILITFLAAEGHSQGAFASFIDYQKGFTRPGDALKRKEDTLQKTIFSQRDCLAREIHLYPFV